MEVPFGSALGREPLTLADDPEARLLLNRRIDVGAFGGTAEASLAPAGWSLMGVSYKTVYNRPPRW
ncbi:MAG TPA: hypothetical protein VLI39_20090 [Sedimentisphaerales bacterium]|nr:hypothetical protein [Sedimentisphaerales bacterium]